MGRRRRRRERGGLGLMIPFHKSIKCYRLFYGYKQEYLAYKLGIEQSNYCLRENGTTNFKDHEIEILKELFKIEIREEKI
jgi:DNA-binding XRE family transcriptional regulator